MVDHHGPDGAARRRIRIGGNLPLAVVAATACALLVWAADVDHGAAQPAPATATSAVTPAPTGPPPDLAGRWSVTRTWFRRCPGCSSPVVRTTSWTITQTGADVRVDKGLRGTVASSPTGDLLTLEGLEQDGPSVYRFWYASLFVAPGANAFEGAFNGSERVANPCGPTPPIVTCLVSAGWIRGQRIDPIATAPTPPGPPTVAVPTLPATATPSPTPTSGPPSPTATASPTPTATRGPFARRFLPVVARRGR